MKNTLIVCLFLFPFIARAQSVYTPYREYIYQVQYRDSSDTNEFYLSMWTTDSTWEADASQRQLFYTYHNWHNGKSHQVLNKDSLAAAWPYRQNIESTGFIENENQIWLHPPRWSTLSILEYFPFPELKRPAKCGSKYRRAFFGHADFLDKTILLLYRMKVTCGEYVIVQGVAKHKGEEWRTVTQWDDNLGLTRLRCEIVPYTNTFINLQLVDIVEHR